MHPINSLTPCLAALLLGVGGLSASPSIIEREVTERVESEHHDFRVVQVVENLIHPWAVTWLPDGGLLITQRLGTLLYHDGETIREIGGLPAIAAGDDQLTAPQGGQQGGLLDVVAHPDFESNGWIYFTFSSPGDDDTVFSDDDFGTGTALGRGRLNEKRTELIDVEVLYVQQPRSEPGRHYGSRIVFPGDGTVIFSIGDNGLRYTAQDLTHPAGSMIRLNEDGGAFEDNPFVGVAPGNLRPEIYSFGHRNNQGLAIHPNNGEIWATGHGPYGGDMLYQVEKGQNYGWPQVAFGSEYSTYQPVGIGTAAPGVRKPEYVWEKSQAPSGLAFYNGEAFPEWKGNLFAGFLLVERVHRLVLEDGEATHEEPLLEEEIGRIRDVREGPDGYLYFLTDEKDGGLYRIEPLSS